MIPSIQIPAFALKVATYGAAILGVLAIGGAAWHYTPWIGAAAQISRIEKSRDEWRADAEAYQRSSAGWESSFREAERLRGQEQATAVAAASSAVEQCAARVAEARSSARVIERIVTKEPTYDQNRCPVRELVDADSLRDALAPGSRPH